MTTIPGTAEFFATATGQKIHLEMCPHLVGATYFPASADDHDVCHWCLAELTGFGRTIHPTIADALRDMRVPEVSIPTIVRLLADVDHDLVYVPYSRSYVALGKDNRAVAWAGKTYVGYRGRATHYLPDYVEAHGGGTPKDERWGDTCPIHNEARSLTGECSGCV